MWIVHFLPDSLLLWFCNILLLFGIAATVAGWFAHRIPFVYQYQLILKIAGAVLLCLGVYFRGGVAVEQDWRARVTELESKLKIAEAESATANVQIKEKIITKDRIVKEKGETIIQRVEVVKTDPKCEVLPKEYVDIHNEAARMNQIVEEQLKGKKK
jgi:type VI protein secretion system component VasK